MTRLVKSAGSAALAFSLTFGLVATIAEQPARADVPTVTARGEREYLTERVSAADLNLASEEGSRRLHSRVRAASRRVCDVGSGNYTAPGKLHCRQSAMQAAAPQMARLIERARGLAAAGQPADLDVVLTVTAPER